MQQPCFAEIQLSEGMAQQEGATETDSRETAEGSAEAEVETEVPRRSTRERQPPIRYAEFYTHNAAAVREPSTHEEAMN